MDWTREEKDEATRLMTEFTEKMLAPQTEHYGDDLVAARDAMVAFAQFLKLKYGPTAGTIQ